MNRFNYLTIVVVLCAVFFASCVNDVELPLNANKSEMSFTAWQETSGTRAYVFDGDKCSWDTNDAISVFDCDNDNNKFDIAYERVANYASFKGSANASTKTWYAVYPYNADATISGNVVSGCLVPAVQVDNGKLNCFLTARTNSDKMDFKHVTSMVQFSLEASAEYSDYRNTKKVVFKANGGEKIAGTISLTIGENGVATYSLTDEGSSEVTIVPGDTNDGLFVFGFAKFAILPQTLSQGFTIEIYSPDGKKKIVSEYQMSTALFARGTVVNLTPHNWVEMSAHPSDHSYIKGAGKKEFVDLGLPSGRLWATCNLGAEEPWEYGDYYAWAATEPWLETYHKNGNKISVCANCLWNNEHNAYDVQNTPYHKLSAGDNTSNASSWSKYFTGVDTKSVLDVEDDAASFQWGDGWRMPTDVEWLELRNNAYWYYTTNYSNTGIIGYIVYKVKDSRDKGLINHLNHYSTADYPSRNPYASYSMSDTHIFLPMADWVSGQVAGGGGQYLEYWSSNFNTTKSYEAIHEIADAYNCFYGQGMQNYKSKPRHSGFSIRAVYDPK